MKINSALLPFLPVVLGSVSLNAGAQLFLKRGLAGRDIVPPANLLGAIETVLGVLLNPFVILGLACYAISIVSWMYVLSKIDVSLAYPFLSIGYIIVAVAGYFWFREAFGVERIAGIALICVGVVLICQR